MNQYALPDSTLTVSGMVARQSNVITLLRFRRIERGGYVLTGGSVSMTANSLGLLSSLPTNCRLNYKINGGHYGKRDPKKMAIFRGNFTFLPAQTEIFEDEKLFSFGQETVPDSCRKPLWVVLPRQ
ncbi:MAG: hypothetical protein U0Y68_09930 [Blastocatellia bacterium]